MRTVNRGKNTQLGPSGVELFVHFSSGKSSYVMVHVRESRHRHGQHNGQLCLESAPAACYIARPRENRISLAAGIACTYQVEQRSEEHTSELQSRPHLVCRL